MKYESIGGGIKNLLFKSQDTNQIRIKDHIR